MTTTSGISDRTGPDSTKVGAWLFKHRTLIPLPVALALLIIPSETSSPLPVVTGIALTSLGELLRLWGVHHIGVISRTRSERLGPLVASGPFGLCRNPLYLGNMAIWVGFTLTAQLVWMAPFVLALLFAEYHAIVRWEESLLEARHGDAYRRYAAEVPRWMPAFTRTPSTASPTPAAPFSWGETLFSERGTLMALAAGFLLLFLKSRL